MTRARTRSAMHDYSNLADLVNECEKFHGSLLSQPAAETLDTRRKLAGWIRKFHRECGTLTSRVEEALGKLESDNCLLLMTAHQPNLFAYSGVLRKSTLNHVLGERLSERLGVPVVSFFGLADQDFTDDRWVRSALLPDGERKNAILELRIPVPEHIMLNKAAKPSKMILDRWTQDIQDWIHRKIKSIAELSRVRLNESEYLENLRELWSIVTDSHERAGNCADFNAYVISRIINDTWKYDTLFCRFSECQQVFKREFSSLIDRFWEYSEALREAEESSRTEDGGVGGDEHLTIPVWYHCECGSKAKLKALDAKQGMMGQGDCLLCRRRHEVDFSQRSWIWNDLSKVSARALTMPLVFFGGLGVCGYVGGAGGRRYLQQANYVANQMGIPFPPVVIWRSHDRYLGLGQLEALLTLRKLTGSYDPGRCKAASAALRRELATIQQHINELEIRKKEITDSTGERGQKISGIKDLARQQDMIRRETDSAMLARRLGLLENSKRVVALYPCIIDHAVNLGPRNVSEQWEASLKTVGDLGSDIIFRTKMDQQLSQLGLQSSWPRLMEDIKDDIID
jgi:hypothetical protein